MNHSELDNHPGWQWCTSEGAELHTLLVGLKTTLTEKLQWLEEAEDLTLALKASREKSNPRNTGTPPCTGPPIP